MSAFYFFSTVSLPHICCFHKKASSFRWLWRLLSSPLPFSPLFPKWRCAFLLHCQPSPWLFQTAPLEPLPWAKRAAAVCAVPPVASKCESSSWYQTPATLPTLQKLKLLISQMQTTPSVITFLKARVTFKLCPLFTMKNWNNYYQ